MFQRIAKRAALLKKRMQKKEKKDVEAAKKKESAAKTPEQEKKAKQEEKKVEKRDRAAIRAARKKARAARKKAAQDKKKLAHAKKAAAKKRKIERAKGLLLWVLSWGCCVCACSQSWQLLSLSDGMCVFVSVHAARKLRQAEKRDEVGSPCSSLLLHYREHLGCIHSSSSIVVSVLCDRS